ncbi:MAG: RNA 2',3'-cyclic phosphodiesterase [Clostridia bacterium]|nr:RNA 2',3'-cyclic phosphodiesterase [Clostridia bacterium]
MRAFLAIEFDEMMKGYFKGVQELLRSKGVTGNYSHPENLHLTVKFLGEIDPVVYEKVGSVVKSVANEHHSFVLSLDSFGKFNKGNKMILWNGLKPSEPLLLLHRNVENALDPILPGLKEKHYSPHITLVREALAPNGLPEPGLKSPISFAARGLSLMESTRVAGKLTYIQRVFQPFKT